MAVADDNVYENVRISLLKFCKDLIDELELTEDFEVFDFDAHATVDELPPKHLIGLAEYALENNDRLYTATGMFVVCTRADDEETKMLRNVISKIFSKLKPGRPLAKVENSTGDNIGFITTLAPVETMPIAATKGRPLMAVASQFGTNFVAPPA